MSLWAPLCLYKLSLAFCNRGGIVTHKPPISWKSWALSRRKLCVLSIHALLYPTLILDDTEGQNDLCHWLEITTCMNTSHWEGCTNKKCKERNDHEDVRDAGIIVSSGIYPKGRIKHKLVLQWQCIAVTETENTSEVLKCWSIHWTR